VSFARNEEGRAESLPLAAQRNSVQRSTLGASSAANASLEEEEVGLGLYVHWPYCRRICPYCDFNVRRWRAEDETTLVQALAADIASHAARIDRRPLASVHFGGGTPSLLSAQAIARVLQAAERAFGLAGDAEIGLEANPEDLDRFADLTAAGVNRLSLGVQALEDGALAALGREHTAAQAAHAVDAAAATGARVSIDLIYARFGQSLPEWEAELRQALRLPVEHLSAYQLTIEPGTAFARAAARGRVTPPDAELAAAFYEATQALTAEAGFDAYEISNHARGPAARSRHNLLYWQGGEWIGVGPGAHGRFGLSGVRTAARAWREIARYEEAVAAHGVGWEEAEALTPAVEAEERVMMGLRVTEGIELGPIERLLGAPLAVEPFLEQGLAALEAGRLRLTPPGRLLADRIARELLGA